MSNVGSNSLRADDNIRQIRAELDALSNGPFGTSSVTAGCILAGNDALPMVEVGPGNAGEILTSNGAGSPSFQSLSDRVGLIYYAELTVNATDLASGAHFNLIVSASTKQYKIRDITFQKVTNFNGDNDRNVVITDGTTTWTEITNAWITSQATQRWGTAGTPFPATDAHLSTASAAGVSVYAAFNGGTTDGATPSGTFKIILAYTRTA